VVVPLKGRTLAQAASELVKALSAAGAVPDPDRVEELLAGESLPKDVIPVGPAAFLLHFRTDAVTGVAVALGVAPKPVFRERDSTREARIIILILAPPGEAGAAEFLQVQGAFARALSEPEVVEQILAARGPDDVLSARFAAIELPGNLTVRDVMTRDVVSVRPDTTLAEVAAQMAARDVSAVPVVNEAQEVIGMMSYRELLARLLPAYVRRISGEYTTAGKGPGKGRPSDPKTLKVKQAMDRSVLCVSEEQAVADVATILVNKDVEGLPVVRDGVLVGFVTQGDIVRRVLGK
jgi:CBS domain-containing protein